MGEYATYGGKEIKIGTCEDMFYLRYDQAHLVKPMSGSLNPASPSAQKTIRFRFPWPDEDNCEPGNYDVFERHIAISGFKVPADVEHYSVQFVAQVGYLTSIPCPEGPGPHDVKVHKNGWRGDVLLVQQAVRAGKLVSIFNCGGCGAAFRVENVEDLKEALADLRAEGKRRGSDFYAKVADRIEEGYRVPVAV